MCGAACLFDQGRCSLPGRRTKESLDTTRSFCKEAEAASKEGATLNSGEATKPDSEDSASPSGPARKALGVEDLDSLPPCIDVPTLAEILGISRAMAYEFARRDQLPVKVVRIGRRLLIPTKSVLALVGATSQDRTEDEPSSRALSSRTSSDA
jgi:predicted DNA-binding transcriptional regulator AlpA